MTSRSYGWATMEGPSAYPAFFFVFAFRRRRESGSPRRRCSNHGGFVAMRRRNKLACLGT